MTQWGRWMGVGALALGLAGTVQAQAVAVAPSTTAQAVDAAAVARHYAVLVHATYEDTLGAALSLQQRLLALVAEPSAERLEAARQAWRDAREAYGQTEAFRFYGGPIDDDKGPEGRLNAWPLDESYIDYVKGKPGAGFINNRRIVISKAGIAGLNERGGEENISAGWHAIEFLLWGQDQRADGAGQRSFEDYVDGKAPNADRRRQALTVITELLVDDLRSLVRAWQPGAPYRSRFEAGAQESVRKIIVGLGSLSRGELAGERMEVALNTQDQEDEHSCFSDNTHRDIVTNALGIRNVWTGRYVRTNGSVIEGASLQALVAGRDAALAARTGRQIEDSLAAAQAIQAPFDQEILGGANAPGRQRVQATIQSLVQQSKDLVAAAQALGITRLTLVKP
ncbi:imelysin family protein [Ideonella livida]|uniref:Iron-regulated protein n=1 Tax=Ideonella livida TaxID=2707176 RepID=A0A7C9PHS6_9BURK|nr:imelysin family protein [Ideonella livida]NDY91571.1 iron-regulated protein [Ideonella livida]